MFRWINQHAAAHRFVRFSGYDVFTSGLPLEVDPILNVNTVCKNTPSLSKDQLELCKAHADVVASALQGAQMAVHECQQQFKYQRWNCSALETKNRNPLTSALLARGKLLEARTLWRQGRHILVLSFCLFLGDYVTSISLL